jgi:hypothetical protein
MLCRSSCDTGCVAGSLDGDFARGNKPDLHDFDITR